MKVRFESKVKAAPGFSSSILFFCILISVASGLSAQNISGKTITLRCDNVKFEKVLTQLTKQSGVQFVYSSSTIELNRPITLQASAHPLEQVLQMISDQVEVTFKKQGEYVVIKRNTASLVKSTMNAKVVSMVRSTTPRNVLSSLETEPYDVPPGRLREYPVYAGIANDKTITKDLFRNGPGLSGWDTAFVIRNLPVLLSNKTVYQYHKKWFASAGLFMNDYSGGIEAQAGIPAFYAVVNGSFLKDGLFRFGYGLGTSIPLKPAISANLSYTFSTLRSTEYDLRYNPYKATAQHHQAKLMANINLSGHFSLRVGPTFNFMNSYYRPEDQPYAVAIIRSREVSPQPYMPIPKTGYTEIIVVEVPVPAKEYKVTKSWFGFEAGMAYRINFSVHR